MLNIEKETPSLLSCPLFAGMNADEISKCLKELKAKFVHYEKDEYVFFQGDAPKFLHVLVKGRVLIGNDLENGKRVVLASFENPGELFGEVFLFLGIDGYDNYAQAAINSTVLLIPKKELSFSLKDEVSPYARAITANLLSIFAKKAYFLNKRVQILSMGSIRAKICSLLLLNKISSDNKFTLSREETADFLGVTRPSLSRELSKMQREGLIKTDRSGISVPDVNKLKREL